MRGARAKKRAAVSRLERAGFPAARAEVEEMMEAATGDPAIWSSWADRRLEGEPLAWLIGYTTFMGHRIRVDRGVYVPRPQTEPIARRAVGALPRDGTAADLCTGSGAIAVALRNARPLARVVATDIDPDACRCAAGNGVAVYRGHLAEPIPAELVGEFDVVVAVPPYVPSDQIAFLPRDVQRYEPRMALDGGPEGLSLLAGVIDASHRLLRGGGSLLLELGGSQDEELAAAFTAAGFGHMERLVDDEGDLRGVHARFGP